MDTVFPPSVPKFKSDVTRISATMKEKCALLESQLKELKSPESIEKIMKSSKLKCGAQKQDEIEHPQENGCKIPISSPSPQLPLPLSNNVSDQFVSYLTKSMLDTFTSLSAKITDLDRTLQGEHIYIPNHEQFRSNQVNEEIVILKNNFIELSTKVEILSNSMRELKQCMAKKKHNNRIKNHTDKQLTEQPIGKQYSKQQLNKHHLNTILFM